jgi:hypothetical protein
VLGTAGIQLQQQRQQTAAALAGQAQNLEQSRAGILTNLFPNLSSLQLNTLQGSENALNTSNNMLPQAGLSGNDIANVWLQRVGATSNINNQAAQVAATGAVNQANAWAPAIGAGATAIGSAATSPAASSLWNTISGGGSDLVY